MRRGKYERPKSRRTQKPAILIFSLAVLLIAVTGATIAFLTTNTGKVTNTFIPAEVLISIYEDKSENTKSNIIFTNPETDNAVPVYIRATLVVYWTDTIDGKSVVVAQPMGASVSDFDLLENGWFQVGEIYYYTKSVSPGSGTAAMLDTITVTLPEGSTAQLHVDIHAEAIQALPTSAVETAWNDVNVDVNGNLVANG